MDGAQPENQPSLIYEPTSYVERLDLRAMFAKDQPLEVELGAGDGTFLVEWAARHPDRNFLGVERLLGRLRKIDKKARRAGLSNVRVMRIEAAYFVEYLLPPQTVHAYHIYFPDPWPKRRHVSRRLITRHFAEVAARTMVLGGVIYLRTDSANYFEQMQDAFGSSEYYSAIQTPDDLLSMLTDFEQEFHARGVRTLHAAYRLEKEA